jgi:hypothetical protein
MPKVISERSIASANALVTREPQEFPSKFDRVAARIRGPHTRHVAHGNVHRVHDTESVNAIHEHAEERGFPANRAAVVEAPTEAAKGAANHSEWRILSGLPGLVVAAIGRWWQIRKATALLADADASVLRDLGIARSGIESLVRHGRR